MTTRDVNIRLAVSDADAAIAKLRGFGTEGEQALRRIVTASAPAEVAINRTSAATDRLRGGIGQLGFQIQDAAVQLQSGTSPFVVLAQQGSQAAGAFGPLGIAIGTVIALAGTAAGVIFGLGRETEAAASSADVLNKVLVDQGDELAALTTKLDGATAATKRLIAEQAKARQADLLRGAESAFGPIGSALGRRQDVSQPIGGEFGDVTPTTSSPPPATAREALIAAVRSGAGGAALIGVAEQLRIDLSDGAVRAAVLELAQLADQFAIEEAARIAASTGGGFVGRPELRPGRGGGSGGGGRPGSAPGAAVREAEREARAIAEAQARIDRDAFETRRTLRERELEQVRERIRLEQAADQARADIARQRDAREAASRQLAQEEFEKDIRGLLVDSLDGFLSGDAPDFWESFFEIGRRFAANQIGNELFLQLKKGLDQQVAGAIPGLTDTPLGNATFGQLAGSGIGGFGLGFGIGQASGSRGLGVLGGAAGGALAGTLILPGVGTVVGGIAGAIGGFFGGGSTGGERNNNFNGGFDPITGRPVRGLQNTKPDPQNVQAVQAVLGELASLRAGLSGLGLGFSEGTLDVQAGNRSGLTLNGQRFDSQDELTEAALRALLAQTTGLTRQQQDILGRSEGASAAEILADLAVPEQIARLVKPLTAFEAALEQIRDTFRAANDNAERLGLSTDRLAAAQTRAERQLTRQALDQARGSAASAFNAAVGGFDALIDPLAAARRDLALGGGVGAGSPTSRLRSARSLFTEALAAARSGGTTQAEVGEVIGLGQSLIGASRDVNASGAGFQRDFSFVNRALSALQGSFEDQRDALIRSVPNEIRAAADRQVGEIREVVRVLNRQLAEFRELKQDIVDAIRSRAA